MAHQFPPMPGYGSPYPNHQYYSPYASTAGQQINHTAPNFHQMNPSQPSTQAPNNLPNAIRYDANATTHQQPAPLPFVPPHFNPDILKNLPPPPLPIPLGFPNFAHVGTPPGAIPQPHLPLFPPPAPGAGSVTGPVQAFNPPQDQRFYAQPIPIQDQGNLVDVLQNQVSDHQTRPGSPVPDSAMGFSFEDSGTDFSNNRDMRFPAPQTSKINASALVDAHGIRGQSIYDAEDHHDGLSSSIPASHTKGMKSSQVTISTMELKERAKAALLSLTPYNIRYENLLHEGVNSLVLQRLYEELGLQWQLTSIKPPEEKMQLKAGEGNKVDQKIDTVQNISQVRTSSKNANAVKSAADMPPSSTTVAQQTVMPSANMERKDRIAQLLAAKAAKSNANVVPSKSQSPASTTGARPSSTQPVHRQDKTNPFKAAKSSSTVRPDALSEGNSTPEQQSGTPNEDPTSNVKTQIYQMSNISAVAQNTDVSAKVPITSLSTVLPTPVREHLIEHGFSSLIPGLFMRSAESEERENTPSPPLQSSLVQQLNPENSAPKSVSDVESQMAKMPETSQKRRLDEKMHEDSPSPKRQAVLVSEDDIEMQMEKQRSESVSDGEIVEDEEHQPQQDRMLATSPSASRNRADASHSQDVHQRHEFGNVDKRPNITKSQGLKASAGPIEASTSAIPVQIELAPEAAVTTPIQPSTPVAISKPEERINLTPRSFINGTSEEIAQRAAQLKANFLRQRALIKKPSQGMSAALVDEEGLIQAKLKEARSKLAQVQSDLKDYEIKIAKGREDESQVLQVIERLETQVKEVAAGQTPANSDLKMPERQPANDMQISTSPSKTFQLDGGLTASPSTSIQQSTSVHLHHQSAGNILGDGASAETTATPLTDAGEDQRQPSRSASTSSALSATKFPQHQNSDSVNSVSGNVSMSKGTTPVEQALLVPDSAHDETEMSAEGSDEAMDESDNESNDSHMSIDDETDDSVSMSDSGSEDYEPAVLEQSQRSSSRMESDEYEPDLEGAKLRDGSIEEEGSDYEPADDISGPEVSDSGLPEQTGEDGSTIEAATAKNNLGHVNTDASFANDHASYASEQLQTGEQKIGRQALNTGAMAGPQSLERTVSKDEPEVLGASAVSNIHFTPYQSALSSLKSFRFHPAFNEQIKDGYRSLTYSHKIDATQPICPTELSGQICDDPLCQDQHFGSMAIPDDKILVQMSSATDIKDKALRDQYLIGLKQVIARLRQEGVKDFSAVASALSQYRRDWVATQPGI